MNIDLPVHIPSEGGYSETLEAELLPRMACHLSNVATFALHRGAKLDPYYTPWWFVSNVETGCMVAYAPDRKKALARAKEILDAKTEKDLLSAYRKINKRIATSTSGAKDGR